MTRHRALPIAACTLFSLATLAAPRAFAVNKDMVQLQTQVQNLQDSVARLQQSNDERMGVLKDLVQQTADAVNKMSTTVQGLEQQMRQQQEAAGTKQEQFSGQISSLNDSVDEVKARLNNLDKALQGIQSQQQSINATLQNMSQPATGSPAPGTPGSDQNVQPPGTAPTQPAPGAPMADNKPSPDVPFATRQGPYAGSRNLPPVQPTQPSGQSASTLFSIALNDYMAAKYPVATEEFNQVVQANPSDQFAGQAWYYLGEIDYRHGKYSAAVKDYDHVLNDYPGNQKTAVSHLHKGQALLTLKDREAAIAEFRAVIQRFPTSPEATQARSKLNGMGVPVNARR